MRWWPNSTQGLATSLMVVDNSTWAEHGGASQRALEVCGGRRSREGVDIIGPHMHDLAIGLGEFAHEFDRSDQGVNEFRAQGVKIATRGSPHYLKKTHGAAEFSNDFIGNRVRTLLHQVKKQAGEVIMPINYVYVLAVRHAAWAYNKLARRAYAKSCKE